MTVNKEHPPYAEMISDAIGTLGEKHGSSLQAIKKYIHNKYSGLKDGTDKKITMFVKRMVDNGHLQKVKASFKLSGDKGGAKKSTKKKASTPKAAAADNEDTPVKPKSTSKSRGGPAKPAEEAVKPKKTATKKKAAKAKKGTKNGAEEEAAQEAPE